ncbi:MAG: N-acetyltransferase [Candidatus Omnitrophica bacterium]|nr:N-acetyltransferase [Candidatus Omnitrophota bacterium]
MIRKARIKDIKQIHILINSFAKKDLMLSRSLNELYENLRDYWVAAEHQRIVACCALHICWDDLAEIKSLAVLKQRQRKGLAKSLLLSCLDEAKSLGAKRVFVLTFKPEYFRKFGFKKISNSQLPHKVWAECINCAKFPDCQEVALIKKI